jgi:SAM-dependent methyltransferase
MTGAATPPAVAEASDTRSGSYADWLRRSQTRPWKRALRVQAVYRWNLRRLQPGVALDIGCGNGRNLSSLDRRSVGIDHNTSSLAIAGSCGFQVYTREQFQDSPAARPGYFDTLLFAHVLEHMAMEEAVGIIGTYREFVKARGKLIIITPQEAGFRHDPSHVSFTDFGAISRICARVGADIDRRFSFPFPRPAGRVFAYNEFVVAAHFGRD